MVFALFVFTIHVSLLPCGVRVSKCGGSCQGVWSRRSLWRCIKVSTPLIINTVPRRQHSRSSSCKKQLKLTPAFSQPTWAATTASMTWRQWWKPGGTDCLLSLMTCHTGAASSCGASITTKVWHTPTVPSLVKLSVFSLYKSCIKVYQGRPLQTFSSSSSLMFVP